ncbi:YqgE/AlgH family protein [Candidatus Parabeggiatoa sp. HSG14]|uniref:YqgE/AlgH family protein n=1 Tax=Candidatus Parabeggiatoa sp. HSG14 TaxID=3055593 RepID=UPI0025A6FDA2|nr:YqgE/AlgH family protein [Thiotrichales bacterium HSG14]
MSHSAIAMLETTYLTNHFLIAMPNLGDPNFFHAVTYICKHDKEGAMGIVINRPMDLDLGDVLEQMEIKAEDPRVTRLPIYEGGPMQRERGFVIHQPIGQWNAMLTVNNNFGIATSRDIIDAIAKGRGPHNIFIALGYAGWGAGQLEQEIIDNIWLSIPADASIIFDTPPEQRWHGAAANFGIDLTLLSSQAGHS